MIDKKHHFWTDLTKETRQIEKKKGLNPPNYLQYEQYLKVMLGVGDLVKMDETINTEMYGQISIHFATHLGSV